MEVLHENLPDLHIFDPKLLGFLAVMNIINSIPEAALHVCLISPPSLASEEQAHKCVLLGKDFGA